MDHREVGRFWDENAEAWSILSGAGYDTYRDAVNTPAFLGMLPDVQGLRGLDIGCGDGHNTRLVAAKGALMSALDISRVFIRRAVEEEQPKPVKIPYMAASAVELPFSQAAFDFAVAFMSFMDIPEIPRVVCEAYRVLKPGGFLQFSISHPCLDTPHRRNLRDASGKTYALEVGGYFREQHGEVGEWTFSAAPPEEQDRRPRFKVPRFTLTLSHWINLLLKTGFRIEQVEEPSPDDATVRQYPNVQDAQVVAYFLIVRVRKEGCGRVNCIQ